MIVSSSLIRGIHHENFNEDFQFEFLISEGLFVGAVMDGCSSADESHFASVLVKKSLHKSSRILRNMHQLETGIQIKDMSLGEIANFMLRQLFEDMKKSKRLFFLNTSEMLSTLIVLLFDEISRQAFVLASGDGLFCVNREIHVIEQNNRPDFLAYHLEEDFRGLESSFIQSWKFENVFDVSISTDGLQKLLPGAKNTKAELDALAYVLLDEPLEPERKFVQGQLEHLLKKGFVPQDDISVIRVFKP